MTRKTFFQFMAPSMIVMTLLMVDPINHGHLVGDELRDF